MPRQKPSLESTNTPPEIEKAFAFVGIFSRVARQLDRTPSHVMKVAKGGAKSKRVTEAIVREVRRIEKKFERTERAA